MSTPSPGWQPCELPQLPAPVRAVCEDLNRAGHAALVVAAPLRALLSEQRPQVFDVATDAAPEEVLALFARAIAVDVANGTVTIPTCAGPVDVTPFRAGDRIEDDLAHRDFTIHAMAYDPRRRKLLDPYAGRGDLEHGCLRAVRSARDRIAEDPLRALRAVRLGATLGLKLDPELEAALPIARAPLKRVAREPVRREVVAIVLAPGVASAFEQLERAGIARDLAPKVAPGAGARIEALRCDLELRLAGWLRGASPRRVLQRLRFSRPLVDRVEQLLRLHPIDAQLEPTRLATVARMARRVNARDTDALLALARAEARAEPLGTGAKLAQLDAIEAALERVRAQESRAARRGRLALSGDEVMALLECEPGPQVGRALDYLTKSIEKDPASNTPDSLAELLRTWPEREGAKQDER